MTYAHKDERLHNIKRHVAVELHGLHPTDRAKAYDELSEWAAGRCRTRTRINDHDGVPDRSEAMDDGARG